MKQHTIKNEISISGSALHSGDKASIRFLPAAVNSGITFTRTDIPGRPKEKANIENVTGTVRGTNLGGISTVEHILSALYPLGITNLEIEIDGPETPILDGSAKPYLDLIKKAGIVEQGSPVKVLSPDRPISVIEGSGSITAIPSDRFIISFMVDFSPSFVGPQYLRFEMSGNGYAAEIAPARTFGFMDEISSLKSQGLAKGATLENAIAIDKDRYLTRLRFKDELVRHKILDLIGDLSLTGSEIKAHIVAVRSGHKLNISLARTLLKAK